MGSKSEQKRQFIIEKAREVFVAKGFISVTMKDIVEACGISRGGLYIYFDNTAQIFSEVMKLERKKGNEDELEKADTSVEMLSAFLREQKNEILKKGPSLTTALYEYYFYLGRDEEPAALKKDKGKASGGEENKADPDTDDMAFEIAEKALEKESEMLFDRLRFDMAVKVLEKLITDGINEGYLECEEPICEAKNIMFAIEGLKISAATIGVSDEDIMSEINYLFSHLFIKED